MAVMTKQKQVMYNYGDLLHNFQYDKDIFNLLVEILEGDFLWFAGAEWRTLEAVLDEAFEMADLLNLRYSDRLLNRAYYKI